MTVINGTSNTVVANVTVGSSPLGVAYASTTNEIFVTNFFNQSVSVINVTTNTVVATIKNFSYPYLFDYPMGVVYVPTTNMVYVTDYEKGLVDAINVTTDRVVANVSLGEFAQPDYMAFNPSNNYLYVVEIDSAFGTGYVSIINPANNSIVQTVSVGYWPRGIAYDAANKEMFVANAGVQGALPSSISAINSKFKVSTVKSLKTKEPWNVLYDSKNKDIYVTDYLANSIYVINSKSVVVQTLTGFDEPTGMIINPSNSELYVSNAGNNTVTVLSGSLSVASIAVGPSPYGIATS